MVFRRTSLSAEDFHGALDSSRAVDAGLLEMSAIWKDTLNAPVTFFFYHLYFIYIKSHHKIVKSLKQRKMIFHRSNYIFFLLLRHRIFESFITQTWSFAWRHVKSSNQIIWGQFTSENRLITVSLFTVKVIYPYAIAPWQWQNV